MPNIRTKTKIYFLFFFLSFIFIFTKNSYAITVLLLEDTELTATDSISKFSYAANELTLTIKNGSTIGASSAAQNINIGSTDDATLIIESGSTLQGSNTGVKGNTSDSLTVTNSGTITVSATRAINLLNAQNATITNNSGGIIASGTGNTINGAVSGGTVSGNTVTNSGTIYATSGVAVRFYSTSTSTTITNNSGGVIYNNSTDETIRLGGTSTLTNSGKIENKNSPSNDAIDLEGNSNTVTLKDGGIVIGVIRSAGSSNTLKFQHGVGQSYYYKTAGNDMTLQDLDGNQVVKGSAGSVGQGGNENLDEQLGYRSLNIRKLLNRYKKSKKIIDKQNGWGETRASFSKRNEHKNNLALGFKQYSLAANIIYPSENNNFLINFETSKQEFQKNHDIKRFGFISGLHFNYTENTNKFINDSFILAGVNLNDSNRKILTNTTSSGTLGISDNYVSYEIHTGKKFNNNGIIPDVGTTLSYSFTPSHSESEYYSWEKKHVANLSAYLSDEYSIERKKYNTKFGIGWILDYRTLISDSKQEYSVNGTEATYYQDDELTREMTISTNINYEKNLDNLGKVLVTFNATHSTQNLNSIDANISYVLEL